MAGAHIKRQLTDVFTAAHQSALAVGLVDLTESVLEKKLFTLVVSETALEGPGARLAGRLTQDYPAGMEPTSQSQEDGISHKEGKPIYLPTTPDNVTELHFRAESEDRYGKYK